MTLTEYKEAIESGITAWFDAEIEKAPTPEARLLLERMCALIRRGGKRARPELLYITYTAYGGKKPEDIVGLGLALEFLHQFLLIHDDIMDRDTERYGGPNILGHYMQDLPERQDIAEAMALLAGDLLFSYSNQVVITSKTLDAELKMRLLDQFNQSSDKVAFGQQLDIYNLDGLGAEFTPERMLQTHLLKTASYTFKLPMSCAVIALNMPDTERRKLMSFGEAFGILFQLADDYSDYFDNDSAFNKRTRPKFRDYPQGKLTYPIYIGLELADTQQQKTIRANLGNKQVTEKDMDAVVAVLTDCGAKTESRDYVERFYGQATGALEALALKPAEKKLFRTMLDKYKV